MSIDQTLRLLAKARGLSVTDLADGVGFSQPLSVTMS